MLIKLLVLFCSLNAAAEGDTAAWLTLDYTYTDFKYTEPGLMSEHGRFAGVRGEVGFFLFSALGLSAGGEYQDGHTDYDGATFGGTPVKVITNDYIRRTEYLAHIMYGNFLISAGIAERYWYNGLQISYRRRTKYNYNPVYVSYRSGPVYMRLEYDVWGKGWNKSHMSDVNPAANDVEFKLGKGQGQGAEIGLLLPGRFTTRVFVNYHEWKVKQSDIQSDGTQNLIEPENNTKELKVGLGLMF